MKRKTQASLHTWRRAGLLAVALVGTLLAAGCARLTDLQLAHYRDDQLVETYRYALGEKYITVDSLRLCYQEQGQGQAESVLILPGLGTSADFWRLNIPALAERFHVLAVDLPGFGNSDKPDVAYDLSWFCDKIIAFLDAKRIQRTHIIGGSLGGHLGLMLALNYPDRVDKLVMAGSCGAWKEPGPVLDIVLRWFWNDRTVTDHIRRNWKHIFTRLFKTQRPITEELFRYQMAIRANHDLFKPEGRASSRALKSIFYSSCRTRLAEVRQPVLLIFGEHDFIHPPKDGTYFHKHLPNSQLHIVADAAHEVMIDRPDLFNTMVIDFFGRHATASGVRSESAGPDTLEGKSLSTYHK